MILREIEPHSAAPNLNSMLDTLARFEIFERPAPLANFEELVIVGEVKLDRQRRPSILFEERTMPTVSQHKVHIDPVSPGRAFTASALTWNVRRREPYIAENTDFGCQFLPNRCRALAAHPGILAQSSLFVPHKGTISRRQ
ncbi:MAG: hypothetical protein WB679_06375 [Terracidiphilus sp.]